jgi:uracil-DNA glycosylase
VYDPQRFRVEWGPIFHRGRLDGTARILVLGRDPGQHEPAARRCLVGEAGQRVQGFLAKLGIDHFYVAINAFLYSVCGQPTHSELDKLLTAAGPDRHAWLDALLLGSGVPSDSPIWFSPACWAGAARSIRRNQERRDPRARSRGHRAAPTQPTPEA